MQDVADQARTSKTTAHYVLTGQDQKLRIAEETRRRVLRAATELRYRPNLMAKGLRTQVTRSIAFISDTVATEAYAGNLVYGAIAAAAEHGYLLFVCETGGDPELEASLIGDLASRHVDAYVYASLFTREVQIPAELHFERTVLLNCLAADNSSPAVIPDERQAGRDAACALLDRGHRRAIWLVGEPGEQVLAGAQRTEGIRQALSDAGTELAGTVDCKWWPEPAYEQFGAFLDDGGDPSAVICLNDRVALGVYQALKARGRSIPTDVSVVSFDDSDLAAWLQPPLSSIALPHRQMAAEAIRLLMTDGALAEHPVHVAMPVRLRESIGPPRS
ncbi:substrate-binding domain-containing protein [Modestobacter muralis]|uniref:Substrate-binding domain-containing protein n=1 Tax=Modestobacter muralis TaxID=1608614 RepID=A0A6P0F5P1_9ACTN|nr:LacI family DNA-binding transcriptional regulator [Modestobacter muralis]NEK96538.1 substrate-binding domain-containing protein [Modestobacter muralis]NEN53438.1 substrate-binding domain-containing protein [Modestobacter muralis]